MSIDAWIIEYCSPTYTSSIFFVWYTDNDENSTDKLLTLKSGEIFSTNTLSDIKASIIEHFDEISKFDHLTDWLNSFTDTTSPEPSMYNVNDAYKCVLAEDFTIHTLECLTNYFNLVGDYMYQDERNRHLQDSLDNEFIKEVWEYFYNYIFWPRFNDKEKFESWDRPPLVIDTTKLLNGIEQLIKHFESNVRIVR